MKPFTANAFHGMPNMLNFEHCNAAEIVKRRILGLHQDTEIGSVDITDTWEPLEEGLNRLETTRHVSVITITLSTVPLPDLDRLPSAAGGGVCQAAAGERSTREPWGWQQH